MLDNNSHKTSWSILAAWRFALATTVVLGHYFLMIRPDTLRLFRADLLNPSSAVFGFFVLSGYSIGASIEREQSSFYKRRALRIWPLYVAAIAFGVIVQCLVRVSPSHPFIWPLGERTFSASTVSVVTSLFMLQSVIGGPVSFDGPLWSLSPEWWHYMVAPKLRKLPTAVLSLLILGSFLAFIFLAPASAGVDTLAGWRVLVVTSWLWVTGFLYFRLRRTPLGFTVLALPATLGLALSKNWGLPLLLTIFVLTMSTEVKVAERIGRFFDFLGDVSYPLYLFHLPTMMALLALGVSNGFALLAGPLVIAALALYGIDLPIRSRLSLQKPRTSAHGAENAERIEFAELSLGRVESGNYSQTNLSL
jgi:peptidoglycan/LPS O-acetylase OafA/YrhL